MDVTELEKKYKAEIDELKKQITKSNELLHALAKEKTQVSNGETKGKIEKEIDILKAGQVDLKNQINALVKLLQEPATQTKVDESDDEDCYPLNIKG